MFDARIGAWVQTLQDRLLEYGPHQVRIFPQVTRLLARGRPLSVAQVEQLSAGLSIAPGATGSFVRQVDEPDAHDQIIGAIRLSLGNQLHHLHVKDVTLLAWCALDTLFLPAILQKTAIVESPSPVNHHLIRLGVSPEQVEEVSPAGAVVSLVVADLRREDLASVEAIWNDLWTHTHFFAAREEGERWVAGRDEGLSVGRQIWSGVLPSEEMGA
jgi:alkylmercury lyase